MEWSDADQLEQLPDTIAADRLLTITRVACELTEAKKRAAAVQTESGADRVSSRPGDCAWHGGWVIHAEAVISSVTGGV